MIYSSNSLVNTNTVHTVHSNQYGHEFINKEMMKNKIKILLINMLQTFNNSQLIKSITIIAAGFILLMLTSLLLDWTFIKQHLSRQIIVYLMMLVICVVTYKLDSSI